MKIAVFGWYGHDNAGDERIKYCLSHFLLDQGGITNVAFYDLHDNAIKGKTKKFDHYDLVIIGGGGLVFSQCNYHDFINGISTKLVTLGISVETKLIGNPKKFCLALLERSKFVVVRDQSSFELLSALGQYKHLLVAPDLTFLKPFPAHNMDPVETIGINLLAKTKNSTILRSYLIVQSLCDRLSVYPKIYKFDDILKKISLYKKIIPIPLYTHSQPEGVPDYRMNDVNILKKYFSSVPDSFVEEAIDACSLFISMRLHGIIFAVQKGVIPLTFNIYPKQVNFMAECGLLDHVHDINNFDGFDKRIEKAEKERNIIHQKISEYTQQSSKKISENFLMIMNNI